MCSVKRVGGCYETSVFEKKYIASMSSLLLLSLAIVVGAIFYFVAPKLSDIEKTVVRKEIEILSNRITVELAKIEAMSRSITSSLY